MRNLDHGATVVCVFHILSNYQEEKTMYRSSKAWFTLLVIIGLVLTACTSAATPTPQQQPAATPTPVAASPTAAPPTEKPATVPPTEPPAPTTPGAKDPSTFTLVSFGDPETLDPHVDYESAGSNVLQNIYEGLVAFAGPNPTEFKPQLAESIPDPVKTDDGGVSYTWKIIDNVKFHNGDPLTTEDVAYSFWRTMLVGDPNAPTILVIEPFLGVTDPTLLVDPSGMLVGDPEALKAADAAKLEAACQRVKDAVTFDEANRTLTMKLVQPWGPFIATLGGGGWAYVVDKKWVAEQGDWDGDCKTWQNYYGIPSESGVLRDKTNGTGPYVLDHWTPGEEIVLTANPDYRKGEAAIKRVVIRNVTEFGTRFAMLQAGDADAITLGSKADEVQMDTLVRDQCNKDTGECTTINPNGILRVYDGLPSTARTDILFTFVVADGSAFLGSGKLDGEGIPPDFFSDVNVRRAFNYCFDWDTYIQDVLLNQATQSIALSLPGQPGYEGSQHYTFDLAKCEEEFKASALKSEDGASLWDTGFYMQLGYNAGNTARQSIAEILSASVNQVNSRFLISPVALPWPTLLRAQRAKQFPIISVGWGEDLHDPHNWYSPHLVGTYADRQNLPQELLDKYRGLVDQGVAELDPAKRAEIYSELNRLVHEDASKIILATATQKYYEPLYMQGWFNGTNMNPLLSSTYTNFYWYDLSKK
jgi:peptide/nickel transport system substrate-binding protein